ncbi:hypothetical protein ACFPTO_21565 [Paraburkholderia denitrificans]|uniref:Transmembrane protein n=1 Tax=Paraburkholderia denitrificans TaxID=694025 RepID=A0ABW0JEB9_9BURK
MEKKESGAAEAAGVGAGGVAAGNPDNPAPVSVPQTIVIHCPSCSERTHEQLSTWKKMATYLLPSMIAAVSAVVGVLVGQKMNASSEADKVIREKLESAYVGVLALPDLAMDMHMAALTPLSGGDVRLTMARYQALQDRYQSAINNVAMVSDLYEPRLGSEILKAVDCSRRLMQNSSNLYILSTAKSGQQTVPIPSHINPQVALTFEEARDSTVELRTECEKEDGALKKNIASAMRGHF